MKKTLLSVIFGLSAFSAFAGGVENKSNMSTGYLRNPSRNAECERPEAAFYNIAGTAFLNEGLYIEAGNQFIFKEYGNELKTFNMLSSKGLNDYYSNDETTVYFYPDADVVFKKGRWSIFMNFGVYAGGGALTYSEGTSATSLMFLKGAGDLKTEAEKYAYAAGAASSKGETALAASYNSQYQLYGKAAKASLEMAKHHSLDVTSITFGGQLGASFLVTDWLSLSAAFRYVTGTQDMTLKCNDLTFMFINGGNSISYKAQGFGESCVFGIHVKPPVSKNLDLSIQYQTLSRISYDVSDVKGLVASFYGITNDSTFRTDLPAVLNLGAGYKLFDKLYLSGSYNYYFNNFASQDSILSETNYDNSWEIAFGADYRICKYIGISAGFEYGNQGITSSSNSTFNPVLDSFVLGGGIEIYPNEKLTITAAGMWCKYFDADYALSGIPTELSKKITMCSIGVTYKPF